jgi:phage shock protein A
MQTFDRARLIARAHVRSLLEKAEDRRKTRQLMLEDMREDIRNVKSLVTNAIADQKLIERQIAESESEAKKWEEHAVFALKKGEDELSRRALTRKHEHVERANRFREQLETQQETIDSLKESLKTLATKLDAARYQAAKLDVYEKQEELRAQREAIVATPTSPEIDTGAFDAYDRLVERVQDLEAQAEAFAELTRDDDLERKFRELQSRNQVESDLEALKAKVAAEQEQAV